MQEVRWGDQDSPSCRKNPLTSLCTMHGSGAQKFNTCPPSASSLVKEEEIELPRWAGFLSNFSVEIAGQKLPGKGFSFEVQLGFGSSVTGTAEVGALRGVDPTAGIGCRSAAQVMDNHRRGGHRYPHTHRRCVFPYLKRVEKENLVEACYPFL